MTTPLGIAAYFFDPSNVTGIFSIYINACCAAYEMSARTRRESGAPKLLIFLALVWFFRVFHLSLWLWRLGANLHKPQYTRTWEGRQMLLAIYTRFPFFNLCFYFAFHPIFFPSFSAAYAFSLHIFVCGNAD